MQPAAPATGWKENAAGRRLTLYRSRAHRAVNPACPQVLPGTAVPENPENLRFDPKAQRFIDDEGANRLIDQPMRAPWRV